MCMPLASDQLPRHWGSLYGYVESKRGRWMAGADCSGVLTAGSVSSVKKHRGEELRSNCPMDGVLLMVRILSLN